MSGCRERYGEKTHILYISHETVYFFYDCARTHRDVVPAAYSAQRRILLRSFRYIFITAIYFAERAALRIPASNFVEKVTILVYVILGKTVTTHRGIVRSRATCNS